MNKPSQAVADFEPAVSTQESMSTSTAASRPSQKDARPLLPRYAEGAPVKSQFPSPTVPALLVEAAKKCPRRTALIYFGSRLSYAQLLEHVKHCAAGLQALGVRKNVRVALMMSNCPQFVIGYFGALRAGAIVTATSSMYTRREAAHQWQDAGATVALVEQKFYSTARAARSEVPGLRTV